MSIYIVGDVQGCFEPLQRLMDKLKFDPLQDSVWFVGDLINRGPDNLKTLQWIRQLPHKQVVLGNHDLHFLAVATGTQQPRKGDTINDLLNAPDLAEIIEWLRRQPLLHYDAPHHCALVHAGLPPGWPISECLARAGEVQKVLMGDNYVEFLRHMYGNQPDQWLDDLTGYARLRIITNYFTRLRYCDANGKLELTQKTDQQPDGYAPWFSFPRQDPTLRIAFGHWAAINGNTGDAQVIALDTGCVWGRHLTALCLDSGRLTQVAADAAAGEDIL